MSSNSPPGKVATLMVLSALLSSPLGASAVVAVSPAAPGAAAGKEEEALTAPPVIIQRITIEVVDVFDTDRPGEDSVFHRFVDVLHIRTRENTVRRELLFREGDPLDPEQLAESERNLRALNFIRRAEVTAELHGDSTADVHVRVQDSWTTRAGYRLSRAGGHTRAELSAQEVNLLGTGKDLGFTFASNQDRNRNTYEYLDRHLFGTHLKLSAAHQASTDGSGDFFSFERPFYSFDTPWAAGVSLSRNLQTARIYSQGEKVAEFEDRLEGGSVYYAFSRRRADVLFRTTLGWQLDRVSFTQTRFLGACAAVTPLGTSPAGTAGSGDCPPVSDLIPRDRTVSSPFVSFRRERREWIKAFNLVRIDRPEDINLGPFFEIQTGVNLRAFGGSADEGLLDLQMGRGLSAGSHGLLLVRQTLDSRVGSGDAAANLVGFQATYYNTRFGHQTLVAHAMADTGFHLDPAFRLLLGGDEGLRGFKSRVLDGNHRFLLTFEDRLWTRRELFHLFYVGGSAFVDAGNAWGGLASSGFGQVYTDVGIGLRLDASRAAHGGLLKLDLAFPLSGDRRGGPGIQFSFGHGLGW